MPKTRDGKVSSSHFSKAVLLRAPQKFEKNNALLQVGKFAYVHRRAIASTQIAFDSLSSPRPK